MKPSIEYDITTAIVKHLLSGVIDLKKDGILEIYSKQGELAEILHAKGITLYHGVSPDVEDIDKAKKRVPKFNKRFHLEDPLTPEAYEHKREILIALNGTPFEAIPSGQNLISVSSGYPSWDDACLALSPYLQDGARTIQFGSSFLTFGVRK